MIDEIADAVKASLHRKNICSCLYCRLQQHHVKCAELVMWRLLDPFGNSKRALDSRNTSKRFLNFALKNHYITYRAYHLNPPS